MAVLPRGMMFGLMTLRGMHELLLRYCGFGIMLRMAVITRGLMFDLMTLRGLHELLSRFALLGLTP